MNAQQVVDRAKRETGLDDFGDNDFLEPLERLLALNALLTDHGREERLEMINRWLVGRLRMTQDWKAHPEIADEDVSDPIIILGLPRSGSTAMQRMMSADPAVQTLYTWQVMNIAPLPGELPGQPEPRIALARQAEAAARVKNPEAFAAHAVLAEDADEDTFLHLMNFKSIHLYALAPTSPDYLRYLQTLPRVPDYQFLADIYKYLQWQQGGKRGPWIIKSPNHLGCIEEMLAVHPNATFINLERDPKKIFASMCGQIEIYYRDVIADLDPIVIGQVQFDFWQHEMERHREVRARLGDRLRIIDFAYADVIRDPVPHIREAHALAGRELSAEGEAAILKWLEDNPEGKFGRYQYELDRYGIAPETIDRVLGSTRLEDAR